MTKKELIVHLEGIPGDPEMVLRHPAIEGCAIGLACVALKAAGEATPGRPLLHFLKQHPGAQVNCRSVILLDSIDRDALAKCGLSV